MNFQSKATLFPLRFLTSMIFLALALRETTSFRLNANQAALNSSSQQKLPKRLLQHEDPNSQWRPMKILVHYLDTNESNDDNIQSFVSSVVMPQAVKFFEETLMVRGPRLISPFDATHCRNFELPDQFRNDTTEADLIIFFSGYNENLPELAWATHCLNSQFDQRPIVGFVSLNYYHVEMSARGLKSIVDTLIHEILHVLAFNSPLYDKYYSQEKAYIKIPDLKSPNNSVIKITSPNVIAFGREHFNCPTFDGIRMENEGGDGSANAHFEMLIGGNDVMIAHSPGSTVISKFTLALLIDSGWYSADMNKAGVFMWGRGAGCGFLNQKCNTQFPEFCKAPDAQECSYDYLGKSRCSASSFSDGCFVSEVMENNECISASMQSSATSPLETFGMNSRCFMMTNDKRERTAACLTSTCTNKGELIITSGNLTATCVSGQKSTTLNGSEIECPDVGRFCSLRKLMKCPNDCGGNGKCREDGTCSCDFLFTGPSCEERIKCPSELEIVCALLRGEQPPQKKTIAVLPNVPQPSAPTKTNSILKKAWILSLIGHLSLLALLLA